MTPASLTPTYTYVEAVFQSAEKITMDNMIMSSSISMVVVREDMGTGRDAGNTIDNATFITPPCTGEGYLDKNDRHDFYKIWVEAGKTIKVSMEPPSNADFDLYLYKAREKVGSSELGRDEAEYVEIPQLHLKTSTLKFIDTRSSGLTL